MDLLIVDDEALARQRLARMVERLEGYRLVAQAANADEAMTAMAEHDPDVVLCDIRMPGQDGLQLAQQISAMEDPPAIIFCTAYDEYALDAFGAQAVDYLLKPVSDDKLQAALNKAQKVNRAQLAALAQADSDTSADSRNHISARTRRGVELIPLDTIHYFLADHKYVTVYHDDAETLIDDTLKELEQEFPERFVRVHRNALVAIKAIEGMERSPQGQYRLRLKGLDHQPVVSRRHVTPLREFLSRL
jgi:two-component system response regulator AlgR